MKSIEEFLSSSIMSIVAAKGLELIDMHILDKGNFFQIRVLTDYPQGGIDMQTCTKLNKAIVSFLEENAHIIGKDYAVEVSSPGADRPLKNKKDFQRVIGRNILVNLTEPVLDKKELKGTLSAVNNNDIEMDIKENKKKPYTHSVRIPYENINWGKVLF